MTKLRTLSDLNDAMAADFAWRKKELHSIKSAVFDNEKTAKRDTYIRAAMAMLYAHWEGFIRNAGTMYLNFVAHQRLRNNELSRAMLALSAGRVIEEAVAGGKSAARMRVVDFFAGQMADRCKINHQRSINTRSNLSSTVLREIVETMGLDYRSFESREKLIDEKLLKNRNHIAHGHYLTVTVTEYEQIHSTIFSMMQEFSDQVYVAASSGAFKAAPMAEFPATTL
ncbi:MAG TPA: MAE_28990/MAE_18760 family HEPN-like nuclease [Pirellulales bacterium]|nr:MAE_28990/MAE_18760 family HEPN-like nuclease [Pirellulales bacterium]